MSKDARIQVLKAGARIVKHSRRLIVYIARVVRPLWNRLIPRITARHLPDRFPPPAHAFLAEARRE